MKTKLAKGFREKAFALSHDDNFKISGLSKYLGNRNSRRPGKINE